MTLWDAWMNGKWRSLAARCVRDAEVGGSNPPFPTKDLET